MKDICLKNKGVEKKIVDKACDPEHSGDEIEDVKQRDNLVSKCKSSSGAESSPDETVYESTPEWKECVRECEQMTPKADDFFQEKHWLDDLSGNDPTETLDMDISDISEIDPKVESGNSKEIIILAKSEKESKEKK